MRMKLQCTGVTCDAAEMSHVAAMSHAMEWQSQANPRSIYSPRNFHKKSSYFTSHPAHTSNLGKVGTVPYRNLQRNTPGDT
jgi:penicillin V acylase-like amidase (Ntn superfamily)